MSWDHHNQTTCSVTNSQTIPIGSGQFDSPCTTRVRSLSPCPYSSCELSDEGRYVIMYVSQGAEPKNKLFYCDLDTINHKIEGELVAD